MLGVAAIALFLSTVVDTPLGAAMGTMAVLVASTLLLTLDAADSIAPYLPTRYWLSFVDLFRDPIHWRDVVRGTLLQGAYVRGLPRRRLGQLRDEGHQDLAVTARPLSVTGAGAPSSTNGVVSRSRARYAGSATPAHGSRPR